MPIAYCLLPSASFSQAPAKKDSLHYFHSTGSPSLSTPSNPQHLYVRDSVSSSSSCSYRIKSAQLKAYLYMGNLYKYGSNTFSGSVNLKIDAYKTFSGGSSYDTYWATLNVNEGKPEALYVKDFTADYNTINRFDVSITSYTAPGGTCPGSACFNDSIQLAVFYDEDRGIGVSGVSLSNTYPSGLTLNSNHPDSVRFKWKRCAGGCTSFCKDVPDYEFQLLRLYNTDSTRKTETSIVTTVDWSKALDIETGSSDTTLSLHIPEGNGYYIWRVRPIGTYYDGGIADSRNWGGWSTTRTSGTFTITSAPSDGLYYTQFDDTLNWIYWRTFSEGDPASPKTRMSEKITYANGLQQVKQTQTYLPSQNSMVLTQTIYDWSGRPALTTLAAPLNWSTDSIKYRNKAVKSGSSVYTALNFDEDTNYFNPQSMTGRIADYYSNSNSDAYVPNAEGYPFSRNLYERDGTARVKEQSGPGNTLRLRSNNVHTTRTFYGKVSSKELLRVFGDEAPDPTSVHKTVNVDPNGIASISYIDKEGKTIATCLSKIDSTLLDTLPSQGTSGFTVNDTIAGNSPYGSYGIVSSGALVLAVPTTVSFAYHLGPKEIKYLCTNYCNNCDYTVEFLIKSDTYTSRFTRLITAASCTVSPKPRFDTTFTRSLNAGSYVIERRVYANNIKPNSATDSTSAYTYLDYHLANIRKSLQDTADARLSCVYSNLNTSNLTGLYGASCLNINTNVTNPDSVFADSSITKNIGCGTIKIPVLVCPGYDCSDSTPDFEGYFNKRWASRSDYVGTSGGFLKYFKDVPSLGGSGHGYRPGEFNKVIDTMLAQNGSNGYTCQQLWQCWDRIVQSYASLDTISDTTRYNLDLLREFLNCTGTKYKGYCHTDPDTTKYKYRPFEYFYYTKGQKPDCDSAVKVQWGDPLSPGWAQDSIYGLQINQKWRSYRDCEENYQSPTVQTVSTGKATAKCGCDGMCEARYESFKQSIIQTYHNDSIYVQGDVYKLRRDSTWGTVFAFDTAKLVSQPLAAYYRTMSQIECAARSMVENCKNYCSLTTYSHSGHTDSVGNPTERANMQKAMTWTYEIKRPSCGAGWDKVSPLSSSGDTSFVKLWERHYGGTADDQLWAMAESKYDCGGYLLAGWTKSAAGNDITEGHCAAGSDKEWWVTRVNQQGDVMWDHTFGGTNDEAAYTVTQTRDGGWLIGGVSNSDSSCEHTQAGRGSTDYWVVKMDPTGTIQWNKRFGGTGADTLKSVCETSDGFILLGGSSASGASGDKSDPVSGGSDFWLLKLDRNGTKLWDTVYGGTGADYMEVVRETKDHNYMLAGTGSNSLGNVFFWYKVNTNGGVISNSYYSFYLAVGVNNYLHAMEPIQAAGDSGFVMAGAVSSGAGTPYEYGIVKLSSTGSLLWNTLFGGTGEEGPYGNNKYVCIKEKPDKGFIIGGSSKSPIGTGNKTDTCYGSTYDYWEVRIDSAGTKKWDRSYGGTNDDFQTAVDVDGNNYYWIAGYSLSGNTGNKTSTGYGGSDYWVIKGRDWCNHDTLCFRWIQPSSTINDSDKTAHNYISCDSVSAAAIKSSIQQQVDQYIQTQLDAFAANYYKTCASPDSIRDTFALAYPLGYHHYTLYYYDRAGNLVRTVPPEGVVYYSGTRSSGTTSHTFKTKYAYNSLKQLTEQYTPDGDTTHFWYDYKGQLRFSRNAKQKAAGKYSYTKYDNLGRIIETGESSLDGSTTFYNNANTTTYPSSSNGQQIYTVYTTPGTNIYYLGMKPQRYLQNRVSYTYTADNVYTYYSYDPSGNVEWLIQDIPGIGKNYTGYEYDLISNKVLKVHYNDGAIDEFHHKYGYDEDQRIKTCMTAWGPAAIYNFTKHNNVGWDLDGAYAYYKHGPLKRLEIGDDKIQGMDYVYTLQGWIKGINYPTISKSDDPGGDGNPGSQFCEDAFGMVLGYHANDFNRTSSKFNPSYSKLVSSQSGISNLYNGNISSWTLQTDTISNNYSQQFGLKYRYDQLNRIKAEDYNYYASSAWNTSTDWDNTFTYDGNGRVLTLTRRGASGNDMDNLTYNYNSGKNQLNYIGDGVASSYSTDIDNQSSNNYLYDNIGEMTKDVEKGIDNIDWTVYGKLKSVKKSNGDSIIFTYDAMNNRVMKRYKPNSGGETITYYIRDAKGSVMSMYDRTTSGSNYVYTQTEVPIYGGDRLGISRPNVVAMTVPTSGLSLCTTCPVYLWTIHIPKSNGYYSRTIAKKEYELKDHLGDVRITTLDRKNTDGTADLQSFFNYYAFGMQMVNPSGSSGTKVYNSANGWRFGYNGKPKDDEIFNTTGTSYDYGMRQYDPRVCIFLSVDPLTRKFPELTPYQFSSNSPIENVDLDGMEKRSYLVTNNTSTIIKTADYTTLKVGHGSKGTGIDVTLVDKNGNIVKDYEPNIKTATFDNFNIPKVDKKILSARLNIAENNEEIQSQYDVIKQAEKEKKVAQEYMQPAPGDPKLGETFSEMVTVSKLNIKIEEAKSKIQELKDENKNLKKEINTLEKEKAKDQNETKEQPK